MRGVNRGMEIRRSVLFFGPNPSNVLRSKVILYWYTFIAMEGRCWFLPTDALVERNVGVAVNL